MNSRLLVMLMVSLFVILVSCNDDDDNGTPAPVPGPTVKINGTVTTSSGDPVDGADLHVIYETNPASYQQDNVSVSIPETSWMALLVLDVSGDTVVVLVDGMMSAGTHRIYINPEGFANGAYRLVYEIWTADRDSLLYLTSRWWLRNLADVNLLAESLPAAVTDANGHYELLTAAGLSLDIWDDQYQEYTVYLNRMTILALHPDYPPVWQTMNVDSGQWRILDLISPDTLLLPPGLIIQVGDTTVIIPDSAQQFADTNFVRDAYLLREFQLATDSQYQGTPYDQTLAEWKLEPWDVRRQYVDIFYPNDILGAMASEHYAWIGSRLFQFGYGWIDTYQLDVNIYDENAGHIWSDPSDPSNDPDDPATATFDGTSQLADRYGNLWFRFPG